jgi:hypothetical protein
MPAGVTQLEVIDGAGNPRNIQTWSSNGSTSGNLNPLQAIVGADVANPASLTNPVPVEDTIYALTPGNATTTTIAMGGTAVTVVTGPCKGGYITNPPNAASQGIGTAENLYVDPVNSPGHTDAAANGTTALLVPGQTFSFSALASGVVIKANGNTTGHKFSAVVFS